MQIDDKKAGQERTVADGRSRVVALTQMLGVESPKMRLSLVKRLPSFDESSMRNPAATRALVQAALFAPEQEIRDLARKLLAERDSQPATDLLLSGLRYPWPSVVNRAANLIAQLKRTDLEGALTRALEDGDPRAPVWKENKGEKTATIREVVRINHLRNCLLCHVPGDAPDKPGDEERVEPASLVRGSLRCVGLGRLITAPIPLPGVRLPEDSPFGYDDGSAPQATVRVDVTYLRQDFSLLVKVPNAEPWPEMQRFDYVVRTRTLTPEAAKRFEAALKQSDAVTDMQLSMCEALHRLNGK